VSETGVHGEVQRADATARRKAAKWLVTIALSGFVLLIFSQSLAGDIAGWAFDDPAAVSGRLTVLVFALGCLTVTPLAVLAGYLLRYAGAVTTAGRYPPHGRPVLRDTHVLLGAPAVRRARLLRAFAGAIAILAVVLVLFLVQLWTVLETLPNAYSAA
jgi:hypothetical protein